VNTQPGTMLSIAKNVHPTELLYVTKYTNVWPAEPADEHVSVTMCGPLKYDVENNQVSTHNPCNDWKNDVVLALDTVRAVQPLLAPSERARSLAVM